MKRDEIIAVLGGRGDERTDRGGDTAFDRAADRIAKAIDSERLETAIAVGQVIAFLGDQHSNDATTAHQWYLLGEFVRRGRLSGESMRGALRRLLVDEKGYSTRRPADPRVRSQVYIMAATVGDLLTLSLLDDDQKVRLAAPGLWLSAVGSAAALLDYVERIGRLIGEGLVSADGLVLRAPSLSKRCRDQRAGGTFVADVFCGLLRQFPDRSVALQAAEAISEVIGERIDLDDRARIAMTDFPYGPGTSSAALGIELPDDSETGPFRDEITPQAGTAAETGSSEPWLWGPQQSVAFNRQLQRPGRSSSILRGGAAEGGAISTLPDPLSGPIRIGHLAPSR